MPTNKILILLLTTLILLCNSPNADSATHIPAPAPAVDCSTVIINLADCLTYVSNGSTVNKPEGSCCSGLKTVLKTDAECLCEGFKNSAQYGIVLNITKAVTLPSACHVSAPPLSNCGLSLGPSAAPASSPTAPPPSSGASELTPATPPPGSSLAPVAPPPGSSGSSALAISLVSFLLNLIIVSFSLL